MTAARDGDSSPLSYSSAAGRWARFGPYYAMFPVDFVLKTIETYCQADGAVLDPFCGRGTVPFIAKLTGHRSVGIDVNPVAYVYSATKVDPEPDPQRLLRRIKDIELAVTPEDRDAEHEFQAWAWSPDVLEFLKAARRILNWRTSRCDRTLMGIILVHLHGKLGNAVSNQMRQSKAMSPAYSVRWWRQRGMRPPRIDPAGYFRTRVEWRYQHGIIGGPAAMARMGDASKELARIGGQFQLVLTSPPYYGVTNYRLDNWIRLWMLGGPNLPDYETSQKFSNQVKYRHLLESVFGAVHRHLADDGVLYVRTDSRTFTRNTTVRVLRDLWPTHSFFWHAEGHGKSQTDLFGGKAAKPGETDILATTDDTLVPKEFTEVPQDLGDTDHEHRSPAHPDDMSETAL